MSRRQKHTIDRVTYYGHNDATIIHNLKKAEKLIRTFNPETRLSVNDILELYHTQLLFDTDYRLKEWKEKDWKFYKKEVQKFDNPIRDFFISLNDENLIGFCDEITGFRYRSSFWRLFNKFNCQKKISSKTIDQLLKHHPFNYKDISQFKKLVEFYEKPLINYIEENPKTVEYILAQKEGVNNPEIGFFLPKSFSKDQINSVMDEYLDSKVENLKYLELIMYSRTLGLTDEIKYKAYKRYRKSKQKLFKKAKGIPIKIEVGIVEDQIEPRKIEMDESGSLVRYSYAETYLKSTLKYRLIFYNFKLLFNYLNFQGCINLIPKRPPDWYSTFFGGSSKHEYPLTPEFIQKQLASNIQLLKYRQFLWSNNLEIEEVMNAVIQKLFPKEFGINLNFKVPELSKNPKIRFRALAPELDSLLKQYKRFVDKGEIDMEFIRFQSKVPRFSELKSCLKKKYVYGKGDEFLRISNLLCSSQSTLSFVKKIEASTYETFLDLITEENITVDDLPSFSRGQIEFLLKKNIIHLDSKGFLRIIGETKVCLLWLYHQGVISYYHFPERIREALDDFEKMGLVEFDDGLLTKGEIAYLNYHLNQKQFVNGYDLRNKYMHGSNSGSENQQQADYNTLLKIFILILLKIYDDLYVAKKNELK